MTSVSLPSFANGCWSCMQGVSSRRVRCVPSSTTALAPLHESAVGLGGQARFQGGAARGHQGATTCTLGGFLQDADSRHAARMPTIVVAANTRRSSTSSRCREHAASCWRLENPRMETGTLLEAHRLSKYFGRVKAVDGLDFSLNRGRTLASRRRVGMREDDHGQAGSPVGATEFGQRPDRRRRCPHVAG